MNRKSYLNASKMVKMCRVCFTQSNSIMFNLSEFMNLDDTNEVPILSALEKVVSAKVLLNEDLPQCICPMCISILKMSYKFVTQFEATQIQLNSATDVCPVYKPTKIENQLNEDNSAVQQEATGPVEIIFGEQKFSLNDIFIVEEPEKQQCDYKGFLENLGREVSATFADKSKERIIVDGQSEDAVSIYVSVNKNNILPVKELNIDHDTNTINCIVLEDDEFTENTKGSENMEYIKIEPTEKDIESFIFKIEEDNDENQDIEAIVLQEKIKKPAKRKKNIKEIESDGVILMEPVNNSQNNVDKLNTENEDDVFEREIQFPCELCKKIYPSKRAVRAHIKRTHFPKPCQFTCEICGYQNNTRSGYMHHKVKHKGKQFVCEICSKTYYTRAVLKVHMATHVNKRQHLCNVCGKGFNYPNALVYHMRLHTGEKKYKCEYCGENFRMPNALKRHERIHTGERPYKCSFCERAFCSKGEVQCHENIHTGYRPYHCKHCWKGFTKTHNLKLHLLSHEGPHRCEICGKSFIEMAILAMHFKIAHKDLLEKDESEDDIN